MKKVLTAQHLLQSRRVVTLYKTLTYKEPSKEVSVHKTETHTSKNIHPIITFLISFCLLHIAINYKAKVNDSNKKTS